MEFACSMVVMVLSPLNAQIIQPNKLKIKIKNNLQIIFL